MNAARKTPPGVTDVAGVRPEAPPDTLPLLREAGMMLATEICALKQRELGTTTMAPGNRRILAKKPCA